MKITALIAALCLTVSPLLAASSDHPLVVEQSQWLSTAWLDYEETTGWKSEVLFDAVAFATERHEGGYRKGGHEIPYIVHPLRVARILWEEAGVRSVNILAAAILHDTVEDTETTLAEIEERFGPRIAATVGEVSDDQSLPRDEKKRLQLVHGPYMSHDAQLVKLADRIDNLRDMSLTSWPEVQKANYRYWGAQLLQAIQGVHPELEKTLADLSH